MSKDKGEEDEQPKPAASLSRRGRIAASVASVVLALAGLAALFLTTNQAGTAVVIAAAALFGVIGLGGHLPTKFKFGDNEITMPIIEAVSKKIESASPQEAGELAERVIAALPGGRVSASGFAYEHMVRSVVLQLVSEGAPFSVIDHNVDNGQVVFSLEEIKKGLGVGRHFDVVLKYSNSGRSLSSETVSKFLHRAKFAVFPTMLITNVPLNMEGRRLLETVQAEIPAIQVITGSTREELLEALRPVLMESP
jgi:hypothetical protein